MGGTESSSMKEIASSSVSEEQKRQQEELLEKQEEKQVKMDLSHAADINKMKEELDDDAKMAQDSIVTQMDEQKAKVCGI